MPGLPAAPSYVLVRTGRASAKASEELAAGTIPIGFVRRVQAAPRGGLVTVSVRQADPILSDGLPWLAALAGVEKLPSRRLEVVFTGRDGYVRDITTALQCLDDLRTSLLRGLVAANVMTEPDAARRVKRPAVLVDDRRSDRTQRLPEIPAAR